MKAFVTLALSAGLVSMAAPAPTAAQDVMTARALTEVCLPYANRQKSFERAIRSARELEFRRPLNAQGPLEEWASEVEMISIDGIWSLRLEEGTLDLEGGRQAYAVTCSLSSTRASARELGVLGRRAFRNERYWSTEEEQRAWERRSANPDEYQVHVRVVEFDGQRPALRIQGLYY